jgi:ATP phosphoribosyltransferase
VEIVPEWVGMLNISVFPVLQIPNLEVWFQRPKDIVRKLQSGDLDLGIVGFDTASEYGQVNL